MDRMNWVAMRTLIFALLVMLMLSAPLLIAADAWALPGDVPEDMPTVPPGPVQYVCPYEVMTAHSLQFDNYSGEYDTLVDWWTNGDPWTGGTATTNFTGMTFGWPYPAGSNVTVLEDKLWINELVGINLRTLLGLPYPNYIINPLMVLDGDTMSHNNSVLWNYLNQGLNMWVANGTINDRSWFPSWLLDYRIYYSSYVNLEPLGRNNISVFGFRETNCSRETYWQERDSFNYAYYTTQKLYQATLQVSNNISTSHYYDVNWYVGFPSNRIVDPQTLRVYDLDNDLWLTLGENYDSSNAGVWMAFARINMSQTRSFIFSIYGWNATIGLGGAIAYADDYSEDASLGDGYYKATATWTNNYGRVYQGMVIIALDFDDGYERYVSSSSLHIYDEDEGRWLEPWEFAASGGMIVVDYAAVTVGSTQTYTVHFKLDMSEADRFDIMGESFIKGISWIALMLGVAMALGLAGWWYKSPFSKLLCLMLLALTFILYIFSASAGGV